MVLRSVLSLGTCLDFDVINIQVEAGPFQTHELVINSQQESHIILKQNLMSHTIFINYIK